MGSITLVRGSQAPGVVRSGRNATKDNVFVYYVSPKGEIEPAADSRISEAQMRRWPGYEHWRRSDAVGVREIEKVSLIISRQMWEKKKLQTVQQRIREIDFIKQLGIRARLRAAQSFSKNDVSINRQLEVRTRKAEADLLDLIVSEFDPLNRRSALEMEIREQSTSPLAMVGVKKEGIA